MKYMITDERITIDK